MPLNIIGYAYGRAAKNPQAEEGPTCIQHSTLLRARNLSINWLDTVQSVDPAQGLAALDTVAKLNIEVASNIFNLVRKKARFLTLGGDHSSGIGTWSGASSALKGPLGLLWVDAHLDSHTPKTSISKNIHGMPVAVLLGYGEFDLTSIQSAKPKILPENLVFIGARSFEAGEHDFLKRLGVKIFYMEDVKRKGLNNVMQEALKIISAKTVGFGISLDLDALDPNDAPGTGAREPDGISASEFLKSVKALIKHPHFIGAEIAEFNPSLDEAQKTEKFIVDLIEVLC